jgi:hypothetical protein
MIENFEQVKAQLEQLAPVINSFQSESVQMRIVELILGRPTKNVREDSDESDVSEADESAPARKSPRRRRKALTQDGQEPLPKARASSGKPSAAMTLNRLIGEGFFKKKRGLGDIVSHCATTLALQYKQSDFSPVLVRAVRDGKLTRTKNESGQFEYEQS